MCLEVHHTQERHSQQQKNALLMPLSLVQIQPESSGSVAQSGRARYNVS